MEAFNRGCDYVVELAFKKRLANKIAIQPFVYGGLRADFGLSSQMAIRAIAKAIEACKETKKRNKNVQPKFDLHGAMVYDHHIMSFRGLSHVSLLTLTGRELLPLRFGAYQEARMDRVKGQADLILRDGVFYLYLTVEMPTPPPIDPVDVLGADLGIAVLAMDSDGEAHTGEGVKQCRRRFQRLRQGLQSCGSKSAKRHLKRIRQKERRYQRWVNHNYTPQRFGSTGHFKRAFERTRFRVVLNPRRFNPGLLNGQIRTAKPRRRHAAPQSLLRSPNPLPRIPASKGGQAAPQEPVPAEAEIPGG